MADDNVEITPPSNKAPMIIIVAVVMALAAGGAVAAFMTVSNNNNSGGNAQAAPQKRAAVRRGPGIGPTHNLNTFIVNLDELSVTRYLKVSITVELGAESDKSVFEKNDPLVRDAIITYLSGLNFSQVSGTEKKIEIKKELQNRINKAVGGNIVTQVFFTEFVIQ